MKLTDEQFDYQPYGGKMNGDFVNRNIPLLLMKINEFLYGCDSIENTIDEKTLSIIKVFDYPPNIKMDEKILKK